MKNEDVDETKLANGEYCRKGEAGCFCKVGWPLERTCPDCRDRRKELSGQLGESSYCVCPPPPEKSPVGGELRPEVMPIREDVLEDIMGWEGDE